MAVKLLTTDATLSTSAGSWARAEAYNLTFTVGYATGSYINFNAATRYITPTFSTASNQVGLWLWCRYLTAGTITIKLQENTGSWVDRTSDSFNCATISKSLTGGYFFALTSYAVTTAPSTWRYAIACNSTTPGGYVTTASGTDLLYAAICDADSAKIGSGDIALIKQDTTLTVDESVTFGAIDSKSMWLGHGSGITITSAITAPITLTFGGCIFISNDYSFLVGTSTSKIPYAKRVTLDFSALTTTPIQGMTGASYFNSTTNTINFYGQEDTKIASRIAADASNGQPNIVIADNFSSDWAIGDNLVIIGKERATGYDSVAYTIAGISGTTVTLNTNLDYDVMKGGAVVNLDRRDECGIWFINGTVSSNAVITNATNNTYYFAITGFYGYKTMFSQSYNLLAASNCLFNDAGLNVGVGIASAVANGINISGIYAYNTTTAYIQSFGLLYLNAANNCTISNVFGKSFSGSFATTNLPSAGVVNLKGNNSVVSGLVGADGRTTTGRFCNMSLSGAGNTYSDIFIWGRCDYPLLCFNMAKNTLSNLKINKAQAYDIYCAGMVDVVIEDSEIGKEYAAGTGAIYYESDTYNVVSVSNTTYNVSYAVFVDNVENCVLGSAGKFHDFNGTPNDHYCKFVYGKTQSTGDGLTDPTVHTSGTGKFAIRFEPTSSTDNFEWDITIPTGNIQNKTMTVGVWCKINNANYYSGTYQLPRLTVDYDNGTTAYCQASASTDWQLLFVTFTPITTYGQIICTVSARTDQTTTNAYVYFDDFLVMYPASVALDLGGMDYWANALPVVPPLAIPISAYTVSSAVLEELVSSHTTTGTFGKHIGKKLLTTGKFIGLK